jgi:hypothetical protein
VRFVGLIGIELVFLSLQTCERGLVKEWMDRPRVSD